MRRISDLSDSAEFPESLIRVLDILLDHWIGEAGSKAITGSPDSVPPIRPNPGSSQVNSLGLENGSHSAESP